MKVTFNRKLKKMYKFIILPNSIQVMTNIDYNINFSVLNYKRTFIINNVSPCISNDYNKYLPNNMTVNFNLDTKIFCIYNNIIFNELEQIFKY